MTLKKYFFSAITALCMAQSAVAVPANPKPVTVVQADGTPLTIIIRGDEHAHLTLTADGYPLFFNTATGNYEYAAVQSGFLAGSGIVAADDGNRNDEALNYLKTQDIDAITSLVSEQRAANVRKASVAKKVKTTNYPTTGEQHSLVILVQFSDLSFSTMSEDAATFYNNMLNQEGFTYSNGADGSARDFYVASSMGQFLPTFDIAGPVTLSNTSTYYGENDSYGNDYRAGEFVQEACEAIDDTLDFSKYDTDGDGYVDNIYLFYAGMGENDGGGSSTIWPHAATMADWGISYTTQDGVSIGSYSCSNETSSSSQTAGIGTFVHEYGHVLGLIDHYSTTYGAAYYVNPGEWDTMATGSYNNDSHTPPLFSAFERAELGWLDYTELDLSVDSVITLPVLADYNKALRVSVAGNDDEYFIMENRQQEGWDAYLPGHGMLVWHIDEDSVAWYSNTANNDATHQRIDIVEADELTASSTYSGDPFPGTSSVTAFDFYSWDDDYIYGFQDVEETTADDDGETVITFSLAGAGISLAAPEPIEFTNVTDESFTVSWPQVANATYYLLDISAVNEDGTTEALDGYSYAWLDADEPTVADSVCSVDVSDVEAGVEYRVSIAAGVGVSRSDTVVGYVTTYALYFPKRTPENITITDINSTGFTASWDALDDADSYIIGLSLLTVSDDTSTEGYDFTSRSTGMPELWYCNHTSWISSTGSYGEASPALVLSSDGDYLRIAYPDTKLTALQLWNKASADNTGTLYIDVCSRGEWTVADSVELSATAVTSAFSFDECDSLRIRFARTANRVYIDDVTVECHAVVYTPSDDYDGLDVGNVTSYTFTGLEENAVYVFNVTGVSGEFLSLSSDDEYVYLSGDATGISIVDAAETGRLSVYDIQGRRVDTAVDNLHPGIYILRDENKTMKIRVE